MWTKVFHETVPILLGIVLSYIFWVDNYWLLGIYLAVSLFLIWRHKDRSEYLIFIYGIVIGFIVEVVGTQVSGYQSFTKPDFWGIPVWLPVAWGYGFVAMKRIGDIISNQIKMTK